MENIDPLAILRLLKRSGSKDLLGEDVLKVVRENPVRGWLSSANGKTTAASRFVEGGYFQAYHKPKFKLGASERVFTIGSCFARSIENILSVRGYDLLVTRFSVPGGLFIVERDGQARGILNKYNPHSMLMEFSRALGEGPEFQDYGLIQLPDGTWMDPQASGIKPASFELVADLRQQIQDVTSTVREASVVVVTLGLTETWYDTMTGLSLNRPPAMATVRSMPGRFSFKNSSLDDAMLSLRKMVDLLGQSGDPRIIVTVSPVPFATTFTGMDVVVANTYSKSVLRCAAHMLAEEYAHVDYFPSYEIVTNTPRESAFKEDMLHVSAAMVDDVMDQFCKAYFD